MSCGLCEQVEALVAHGASARASSTLKVDRAALRKALGGRGEIVERIEAKASGRPTVNTGRIWALMMSSLYSSGDLPVLAVREGCQNSIDSMKAAIRARLLRQEDACFEVTWTPNTRSLSFEDRGQGMDADTILTKFLSLGDSGKRDAADSGEAAGGFGIAKAVILGVSKSFRWELHTRDNLAVARGADQDVAVFPAEPRIGTKLTVHDLDEEGYWRWDRARGAWVGLEDRIRELLGANDLPGFRLVFNGVEVQPLFSRRGGSKVKVEGAWGNGTTAAVKAYRRSVGDRAGAYYIRLNGLFQFKHAAFRGGLKSDFVIDLTTTVRPADLGYPLNAARDGFQGQAAHTFRDLADEIERESESADRDQEDEVFDPLSDDPHEREGAEALGQQLASALQDETVRRALASAAGGLVDFYAEQAKNLPAPEPATSRAAPGSRTQKVEPIFDPALPGGFKAAVAIADREAAVDQNLATVIRTFLQEADEAVAAATPNADRTWVGRRDRGILTPAIELALDRVAAGEADNQDASDIEQALERALDAGMNPGGAGLFQVAAAPGVLAALDRATGQKRARKNPFGAYAGLRISKKNYDKARARRFLQSYARWVPHLLAWDGVLRVIASEARLRRRFKPGFVLDDQVIGLASRSARGELVISLNPDRFAEVVKAHRERPVAIAAFLHSVAVHELTHADGRMGQGHDEAYISAREDLGHATAHLLPAIAALVSRLLELPTPPDSDAARAERLAAKVDKLEEQVKVQRSKATAATREVRALQDQLAVYTTPGTRLCWSSVREWLSAWHALEARPLSSNRHAALAAHLEALPDSLVASAGAHELDALEPVLRANQPVRGRRQGHPTTRLLDAIDRARHGGRRRTLDPEALLQLAANALRSNPPEGLDASDIDAFLRRNRPALIQQITLAFGGAAA